MNRKKNKPGKIFFLTHNPFLLLLLLSSLALLFSCSKDSNPVKTIPGKTINYTEPTRVNGSPYPYSKKPDTLYTIDDSKLSPVEQLTISSLQGILAQSKPRIYRLRSSSYSTWVYDLTTNYGIIADRRYEADFKGLIKHFKKEINGYILTYITSPSLHYAVSLSGISKSIVVTSAIQQDIEDLGIPMKEDVTGKNYTQFIDEYSAVMNKNILGYQKADRSNFLSDYLVFGKAFFFYDNLNGPYTKSIFNQMNSNSVLLGWGDSEDGLVKRASEYGIMVNAADWALNISTLSNIGVETKQLSHKHNPEVIENVHTVCFLMTDGDNIQWTLGDFSTSTNWYGSSNRGKVNIGWTAAPALTELAPSVLRNFYDNASQKENARDYFVAGPSGMGYTFPDTYKDLNTYAMLTNEYMKKADLRILNIIGNSINQDYLEPFTLQPDIDAIFYYYYSSYVGGEGKIYWVNGKPVITGRLQLWVPEFDSAESLAEKINYMSTDITSSRAYSLIPVHVWSQSVDDVIKCTSLFNKNVRVVAPDEFVALIKKNIKN